MIILSYDIKTKQKELFNRIRSFDNMSEVRLFLYTANNNPDEILIGKPIIMEDYYYD
jgi:hypothetical protein